MSAEHFIATILGPVLNGQDPLNIELLTIRLRLALFGHPFTKAALEMALWDILGKAAGLPVYQLLGGAVRGFVPLKWSISGVEPERAAEIAAWALQQGFRTMKVKVGIDPVQDIERVRAVRDTIGPDVRLGVDANGAWDVRTAVKMIRNFSEYGIYFAEQPVPPGDVNSLAAVRSRVDVPILADESVYNLQDALSIVKAGAADAISIYVGKAGGIGPARKIAALAEGAMLGCTIGSNLELGIGSAAMAHLAMATPGITADEFPCDIIGPLYYTDELLREPLAISGAGVRPSDRPGLGVDLDEAKVQHYRVL